VTLYVAVADPAQWHAGTWQQDATGEQRSPMPMHDQAMRFTYMPSTTNSEQPGDYPSKAADSRSAESKYFTPGEGT
jgi:hypothetical protein